jgi:hypothetical protein
MRPAIPTEVISELVEEVGVGQPLGRRVFQEDLEPLGALKQAQVVVQSCHLSGLGRHATPPGAALACADLVQPSEESCCDRVQLSEALCADQKVTVEREHRIEQLEDVVGTQRRDDIRADVVVGMEQHVSVVTSFLPELREGRPVSELVLDKRECLLVGDVPTRSCAEALSQSAEACLKSEMKVDLALIRFR